MNAICISLQDMTMDPIHISEKPTLHPDCCCPISIPLIRLLSSMILSVRGMTISISSGSGLLEALLLRENYRINIHGIEVANSINRYLPDERMQPVHGTWDLSHAAKDAIAWLFVYPRDLGLIKKYIQAYGEGAVEHIIWIGPLADLAEIDVVLQESSWCQRSATSIGNDSVVLFVTQPGKQ